jgi:transposase
VTQIDITDASWWRRLVDLIHPDGAVIAAEPTGTHMLTPIARLITQERPNASIWQVNHDVSGQVRNLMVSSVKSDRHDSIALCLIAMQIADGQAPLGTKPFMLEQADHIVALRLLVNQQTSLTKEMTRTINRIRALAYQINPVFARSETYLNAVLEEGIVTIDEMREASASRQGKYADGRARRHLDNLIDIAAPIPNNPMIADMTRQIAARAVEYRNALKAIEQDIDRIVSEPPFADITEKWRTMKGFSSIYAAAILVACSGEVRSMSKNQFVACLGLNPRISQSGNKEMTEGNKRGYRPARNAMHLWTMGLIKDEGTTGNVYEKFRRVKERGGKGYAAAKTKLARVLWGVAQDKTTRKRSE